MESLIRGNEIDQSKIIFDSMRPLTTIKNTHLGVSVVAAKLLTFMPGAK
jgi:hypothetical protein